MDESLARYELTAAFLIVVLRLVYDGPSLVEGPMEVDLATTTIALALAVRLGHLIRQDPVTADEFDDRLRSAGVATVRSDDAATLEVSGTGQMILCAQLPGGRRYSFTVPNAQPPDP